MTTKYGNSVTLDTGDFDRSLYPIPPLPIERVANECRHTPTPPGYGEFTEWANECSKTHRQIICQCCSRWMIWLPKSQAREINKQDRAEEKLFLRSMDRALKE